MLFLAIETTSRRGGLALFRDRQCLRETLFSEGLVHGREIASRLSDLLRAEGLRPRDLAGLAVGIGPGSYTGCRVGATAAKTIGLALRLPTVAVSSLEVIAATAFEAVLGPGGGTSAPTAPDGGSPGCPVMLATLLDGRRGFFYGALFSSSSATAADDRCPLPVRRAPDQVGRLEEITRFLEPGTRVCGDGADLLLKSLEDGPLARSLVRGPESWDLPSPGALGRLAARSLESATFEPESLHRLEPAYLRPSEPEILMQEKELRQRSGSAAGPEGRC